PADAGKTFHIVVPWGNIAVTDGPRYPEPVFGIGLEVDFAHAQTTPPPHQRPSAHVVSTEPIKPLDLCIWAFFIIYPETFIILVVVSVAGLYWVCADLFVGQLAPVFKFPRLFQRILIIFNVLNVPP